uniref:Uncharacterized protein n=1 Tax=Moniliophthora roreri TaxID=221103 RepID=A0A0W0G062_MONRR
MPKFPSLI